MNQIHTEREQRFIDLAAQLADDFGQRAAQHDEDESFPFENYERMRDCGYTNLIIPEEFGGLGASLLERIKAQERLAQGDGATALAINMHFNVLGLLVDLQQRDSRRRAAGARDDRPRRDELPRVVVESANIREKLQRIGRERLICGGSGSEPDNAVINLRPRTEARRAEGGFSVTGRKIFGTQSIRLDYFFAEATWADAPERPTIITFFVEPKNTPGLEFKDDWHTMGMRSTASCGSELKDAFVSDSAVILRRAVSNSALVTRVFAKAPFSIGAPYVGIAAAARDFVVEFMRDRPRYPLKKPMSHLPAVFNKVGEMDMLIEGARAAMWKAAGEVEHDEPANWARKALAACMIARENAVRVVDLALRAVGGASYFKRLPLERLYRDVRAGLYHPFDSDESIEFLGRSAFGLPMGDPDDYV